MRVLGTSSKPSRPLRILSVSVDQPVVQTYLPLVLCPMLQPSRVHSAGLQGGSGVIRGGKAGHPATLVNERLRPPWTVGVAVSSKILARSLAQRTSRAQLPLQEYVGTNRTRAH